MTGKEAQRGRNYYYGGIPSPDKRLDDYPHQFSAACARHDRDGVVVQPRYHRRQATWRWT